MAASLSVVAGVFPASSATHREAADRLPHYKYVPPLLNSYLVSDISAAAVVNDLIRCIGGRLGCGT